MLYFLHEVCPSFLGSDALCNEPIDPRPPPSPQGWSRDMRRWCWPAPQMSPRSRGRPGPRATHPPARLTPSAGDVHAALPPSPRPPSPRVPRLPGSPRSTPSGSRASAAPTSPPLPQYMNLTFAATGHRLPEREVCRAGLWHLRRIGAIVVSSMGLLFFHCPSVMMTATWQCLYAMEALRPMQFGRQQKNTEASEQQINSIVFSSSLYTKVLEPTHISVCL